MQNKRPTKALVVTTMFDHGGVTSYWKDAIEALGPKTEWLFFVNQVAGVDSDPFKKPNVAICRKLIWDNPIKSSLSLIREVKMFAPQTVVLNATLAALRILPAIVFLRLFQRNTKIKCVFHNGAIYQNTTKDLINKYFVSFVGLFTHENIFVSEFVSRYWLVKGEILKRPFTPVPRETYELKSVPRIGFLGRISPEKDPKLFLEAVSSVQKSLPITIDIAGLGSLKEPLEAQYKDVIWRGWVQPKKWLETIDLLVTTSKTEGWPISIGEAHEAGAPVIGIDVGGVSEIICGVDEQWLQKTREPEKLAQLIRQFLQNYAQNSQKYFRDLTKSDMSSAEWAQKILK